MEKVGFQSSIKVFVVLIEGSCLQLYTTLSTSTWPYHCWLDIWCLLLELSLLLKTWFAICNCAVRGFILKFLQISCKAVTVLMQYFFLAAFSWMRGSYDLPHAGKGILKTKEQVVVLSAARLGYVSSGCNVGIYTCYLYLGIPVPFVTIGLGAFNNEYGVKDTTGKLQ